MLFLLSVSHRTLGRQHPPHDCDLIQGPHHEEYMPEKQIGRVHTNPFGVREEREGTYTVAEEHERVHFETQVGEGGNVGTSCELEQGDVLLENGDELELENVDGKTE